ncbi:hypothetical protein SteCoe_7039 [Stentor coeruleus]|uniref:Histidine kinase n=1 Tax=Stentor coeruleus TaxID=5963 RepID=A0A1R2CNE9_9CILI|nr:hypothetical protein SteCoe_7039 [Stentor coeruleus]
MCNQEEIKEVLGKYTYSSGYQRLELIGFTALFAGIIGISIEFAARQLNENIEYKLIFILANLLNFIQLRALKAFPKIVLPFSYLLGEFWNLVFIYLSYGSRSKQGVLWSQLATYILFYYQTYMLKSFKHCTFFSVKQTLLWLVPALYYSDKDFPSILEIVSASALLCFMLCAITYFEYKKDKDICEARKLMQCMSDEMALILDTIPDFILVISENQGKVFSNASFNLLIKDLNVKEFFSQCFYKSNFECSSENSKLIDDIYESLKLPEGAQVPFGITENNSILIDWHGKIINFRHSKAIILSGRNVTKIATLEKKNAENEYRSALMSTVSHELRTPTNAILTIANLIKESCELSELNKERIEILIGSCSYQLCLINDLLDYAQIVAGCLKIFKVPINISQLVTECTRCIEVQLGTHIKLAKKMKRVPEILISDPNRLKQIILNLLSNARKFTKKGCISLQLSYSRPYLKIKCSDTGIGIAPEKLSKLFSQFGRLEESCTINPQGVGLGLAISNMLATKLGGNGINVTSKQGQGSCFSLIILAEEPEIILNDVADEDAQITLPSMLVKTLCTKFQVLIVDDIYFNIMAYSHILKSEGLICDYALNGEEAIEKILETDYSCIIMDCEMPILDGWETTKRIHKMKSLGTIKVLPPIIGATAHTDEGIREKCLDSGMHDVIIKPCPKEDLIDIIKYWILA